MRLCEYGCSKEAKYKMSSGKWCCETYHSKCPKIRNKNSKGLKKSWKKPGEKERRGKIMIKLHKDPNHAKKMEKIYKSESHRKKISETTKQVCGTKEFREKIKKIKIDQYKNGTVKKAKPKKNSLISYYKTTYLLFSKIEEMRYNPDKPDEKEIQVNCKNHNCKNSKEQDGWFTPTYIQFYERIRNIEHPDGIGGSYFYCCNKCKDECPLYNKSISQLIKEDQIKAGHIEEEWYNSVEYQTWRTQVFKLDNSICQYCENTGNIAHHILPQKTHPELALDSENGITVCEECHFKFGHKDLLCTTGFLSTLVCKRIIRMKEKI